MCSDISEERRGVRSADRERTGRERESVQSVRETDRAHWTCSRVCALAFGINDSCMQGSDALIATLAINSASSSHTDASTTHTLLQQPVSWNRQTKALCLRKILSNQVEGRHSPKKKPVNSARRASH
eukprot:3938467-Rhodomonas_salina.1